jgi:chromatin structure-remodeling complex subunit RSC9
LHCPTRTSPAKAPPTPKKRAHTLAPVPRSRSDNRASAARRDFTWRPSYSYRVATRAAYCQHHQIEPSQQQCLFQSANMAPTAGEIPLHTIDRTPEYEDFMSRLREYHLKRGTTLDPEPKVGAIHLDLLKVFNHIVASGGYDKVSEEKLAWRRMASELGLYSNNEASTAFALKEKFYKNLAAFEISTVHGKDPPPRDILEDVTAKGANLLTRTRDNFRGKRDSNLGGNDSAASGDDGTPVRERPVVDPAASARASRGLREAPAQRVIFQPDTGPTRSTRQASQQQTAPATASPAPNATQSPVPHPNVPHLPPSAHHSARGPSIVHHQPTPEDGSYSVAQYQPRHTKPLPLRAVATPSTAPNEFQRPRIPQRYDPSARQPMQPGGK